MASALRFSVCTWCATLDIATATATATAIAIVTMIVTMIATMIVTMMTMVVTVIVTLTAVVTAVQEMSTKLSAMTNDVTKMKTTMEELKKRTDYTHGKLESSATELKDHIQTNLGGGGLSMTTLLLTQIPLVLFAVYSRFFAGPKDQYAYKQRV